MRSPGHVAQPFEQLRYEELPERPRVAHRYYDAEASTVVVQSAPLGPIATHVVAYGPRDAPPLLLIHGLMTSSYSWRYMFDPLGDRFRLIVPDLPGCGRSAVPAADRPLSGVALGTFVAELQQTLGIGGCPTVANSLGGLLCMHAAIRDPASFERLVVIHAPAGLDLRLAGLHVGLALPGARAILERLVRRDPLRWAHYNVHYYDETLKSLEEAREYGVPLASATGARAFIRYLDDPLDARELRTFERVLRRRRDGGGPPLPPLMLVYSREDPTVPPSAGAKLHALVPDSEFRWMGETSHFPQVDRPGRLAELLVDFLERP